MVQPKLNQVCRECGVEGPHYPIPSGNARNPCVACIRIRTHKRWLAVKGDPELLAKKRAHDRRWVRSEKGKAQQRAYLQTPKGRAIRRRYQASDAFKTRQRERRRMVRARVALRKAVSEGRVIPLERCEACNGLPTPHANNERGLEAHHYAGYDRPHWLDVRWLCIPCHRAEHGDISGLGGGHRWYGADPQEWPDYVKGAEPAPSSAFSGFPD